MQTRPNFSLHAISPDDLVHQLAAIDITVPLVSEGRTKEHCEQYMMARLLATTAKASLLRYPLQLIHGDKHGERPDFVVRFGQEEVGVECVEANHSDHYHIEDIRERLYPEAMNFGQRFEPGKSFLTSDEKHDIASGEASGPPWMSGSMKRNWIAAMEFTIAGKTEKLRKGNYEASRATWLLVHDEWPNPIHFYPEAVRLAAKELHAVLVVPCFVPPAFDQIFLESGKQLFRLDRNGLDAFFIPTLWNNGLMSL
jgi:hypothetical protein